MVSSATSLPLLVMGRKMIRDAFHVPENYFLSHSVGCLGVTTGAYFKGSFLDPWKIKGGGAWSEWMDVLDRYRHHIGEILNCDKQTICPQTNISSGLTKIIHSLPRVPGKTTIVLSQDDFPTIGFVVKQAQKAGYSVKFIKGDPANPQCWADAIDASTAIVHITHAFSNTSKLGPVRDVCALARTHNAISIVDVAQSAGVVPIDVLDWHCDFALGTGVKFLCCGPGACFLYASNQMIAMCEPIDVGWFSHEDPFEMDIHQFQLACDAMRFFGGTPSPAPFVMANCALSLWQEIGLAPARAHIQTALSYLTQFVPGQFLVSPSHDKRGATLVVNPPDRTFLTNELNAHAIHHDERREGFRFSVHGYTSENEIELLASILKKIF